MSSFVAEIVRGAGPVRATGIADPSVGTWIVGDVRLDARDELRDALRVAGRAAPRGATDIELVLAAWHAWGETATDHLRGDFSFALWDAGRRMLFCARDALGVRPLYWAEPGDHFICSNTLDAVRAHPLVSPRLHTPAIVSFLERGYNDDTSTTSFADIRRLAPAHQLIVRADSRAGTPTRYWSFPVPEPLRLRSDREYIERFRDVLGSAVRDRLRGDNAGILLSGGLDSTSLAATARRVAPDVKLFAWTDDMGPSAPPDEVRLAKQVAARLALPHEVTLHKGRTLAHLTDAVSRTPEPLDEPEWNGWRDQLARVSAKTSTLIIGEDGDALFRPPGLLTMLRSWPAHDVIRRVIAYTISYRHHPHLGVWLSRRLNAPFMRLPRGPHRTRPDAVGYLSNPIWQSVLETAQPAYTGVALEMVWPLLDTRVIEFVFSIPPVPWCQRKELMRQSFRGELPDEVLSRKKSPLHGFSERQVAEWRVTQRTPVWSFGEAIREFVDTQSVANTLQSGSVESVLVAWRVLSLDRWLESERSASVA